MTAGFCFSTRWKGSCRTEEADARSTRKAQVWSRKDREAVAHPWLRWHLLHGGRPVHCRTFSDILGFHPVDARGTLPEL